MNILHKSNLKIGALEKKKTRYNEYNTINILLSLNKTNEMLGITTFDK